MFKRNIKNLKISGKILFNDLFQPTTMTRDSVDDKKFFKCSLVLKCSENEEMLKKIFESICEYKNLYRVNKKNRLNKYDALFIKPVSQCSDYQLSSLEDLDWKEDIDDNPDDYMYMSVKQSEYNPKGNKNSVKVINNDDVELKHTEGYLATGSDINVGFTLFRGEYTPKSNNKSDESQSIKFFRAYLNELKLIKGEYISSSTVEEENIPF